MGWIVMGIPDKVKRHFRMEKVCMMNSVVGCSCRLVGGGVGGGCENVRNSGGGSFQSREAV